MTTATTSSDRATNHPEPGRGLDPSVVHGARIVSRAKVVSEFSKRGAPALRSLGFRGRSGHLVRFHGPIVQVIELQHSIYGSRVTANLGVTLEALKPVIRWVAQPAIGPHAHDCARWARIGMVAPDRRDLWWSFEGNGRGLTGAVEAMAQTVLEHGVRWLDAASEPEAFLTHAREKLERSKSPLHPSGRWMELRLVAAAAAATGDPRTAGRCCERARALWEDERARLKAARRAYKARHPRREGTLARVPDLQAELERLIAPTMGASARKPGRAGRASRPGRR